jgi:hypothetical protein
MAVIDLGRSWIGIVLFLLASPSTAQKPGELTAVLTRIDGQVTLSAPSRAEPPSIRRAAQRQVLRRGEIVHVPPGAQMTLICSTERLVSLTGPRDWVLDATACGQGLPLPESSYRNLTSYAGRILPRNGALLLELETRNVETGLGPILLSPRDTAVIDAYPRFVWTRVPDAVEYEIELRGPVETSIRILAADLPCGPGSGPWRGVEVCSWTPSGKWPALEPEKPLFLKLGSRQTLAASMRQVRQAYKIQLLSAADQQRVRASLDRIAALPLDQASRLLLTAAAYTHSGLVADAIAAYDEALSDQEMSEARVTLGDLYLNSGLIPQAEREYGRVLAGAPDSAARAAAELGLGQVSWCRKRFSDAREHFERASRLYADLGLKAEAEDARAAAALITIAKPAEE